MRDAFRPSPPVAVEIPAGSINQFNHKIYGQNPNQKKQGKSRRKNGGTGGPSRRGGTRTAGRYPRDAGSLRNAGTRRRAGSFRLR